jgi:hypothetical protein
MDFSMEYLSFFVINSEGAAEQTAKRYKHFKTLDAEDYESSEVKRFLDGEFGRIVKRKAEKHPSTESAPTKIGRFVVEPGFELDSNPNYNMIQRCREAGDAEQFHNSCDDLLRAYIGTSSVRGGAFIVARAVLRKYFDVPFLFILKCDFEPKIARITDEQSMVGQVDMAISAKSMKSIQYPHMPEDGILEVGELKIHQASHARYFEEFLAFVSYEQSMPELVHTQVMEIVQEYVENKYRPPEDLPPEELPRERMEELVQARQQEEQSYEVWAASEQRELQERWDHQSVVEATQRIVEFQPEMDMKFHIGETFVKAKLAEYGNQVHIARLGDRFVVLLEGDSFRFDKDFSPVELLQPEDFEEVVQRIRSRPPEED